MVRESCQKNYRGVAGGYAEAAEWLDVTENALFNRLRADGDRFSRWDGQWFYSAAGTHYIADAVAQSAGGCLYRFLKLRK